MSTPVVVRMKSLWWLADILGDTDAAVLHVQFRPGPEEAYLVRRVDVDELYTLDGPVLAANRTSAHLASWARRKAEARS